MKAKSNRLFSLSLFLESLRQIRLMGFVYLALCVIFAVLPALLNGGSNFQPLEGIDIAPVLILYQYVAPITMGFALFGYLTRRNASDFYHSLPVTRECAFFSRAAALAAVLLGTVVITVLAGAITNAGMGRTVLLGQLPWLISNYFLSSLMVLSCTLVGLASAGTYFSAFIVAGLMMFLPGYLGYMVYALADSVTTIVYPEMLSPLLDMQLNLPVGQFVTFFLGSYGVFSGRSSIPYLAYLPAHLVTLGISLAYLAFGAVIHHCRRSEIARASAPNRFLQHLYRCLISSPIFLLVGAMIAMDDIDGDTLLWLSVIGLMVYFLYEIVTTRKVRNLWGALKTLPIVLIACFVLPLTGALIGNMAERTLPARDKIRSVTLNFDQKYNTTTAYSMMELCEYEYTDEAMIDLLYGALEDTVERYKDGRGGETAAVAVPATTTEVWTESKSEAGEYENYRMVDMQFNLKNGQRFIRKLHVSESDWDKIWELRKQDEFFQSAVSRLPQAEQLVGMRLGSIYLYPDASKNVVSDDEGMTLAAIWEVFQEEYAQLDPEQQLVVCNFSDASIHAEYYATETAIEAPMDFTTSAMHYSAVYGGTVWYDLPTEMTVTGIEGARAFRDHYTITSLTPRTFEMVIEYINEHMLREAGGELPIDGARDHLNEVTEDTELNVSFRIHLYDPQSTMRATAMLDKRIVPNLLLDDPDMQANLKNDPKTYQTHEYLATLDNLLALMQTGSATNISIDQPFIYIDVLDVMDYTSSRGWGGADCFLQLDRAEYDKLVELLSEGMQ